MRTLNLRLVRVHIIRKTGQNWELARAIKGPVVSIPVPERAHVWRAPAARVAVGVHVDRTHHITGRRRTCRARTAYVSSRLFVV